MDPPELSGATQARKLPAPTHEQSATCGVTDDKTAPMPTTSVLRRNSGSAARRKRGTNRWVGVVDRFLGYKEEFS